MPTAQRMVCAGGILSIQKNSRERLSAAGFPGKGGTDAGDEDFIAPHAHRANIDLGQLIK